MRRTLTLAAAALIASIGLAVAGGAPASAAMPGLTAAGASVGTATPTAEKVHYTKRWWKRRRAHFRKRYVPYYVYQPYYYYDPYYYAYPTYYYPPHYIYKRRRHHGGINFGIVIGF